MCVQSFRFDASQARAKLRNLADTWAYTKQQLDLGIKTLITQFVMKWYLDDSICHEIVPHKFPCKEFGMKERLI